MTLLLCRVSAGMPFFSPGNDLQFPARSAVQVHRDGGGCPPEGPRVPQLPGGLRLVCLHRPGHR